MTELDEPPFDAFGWSIQSSGVLIPNNSADPLEQLWISRDPDKQGSIATDTEAPEFRKSVNDHRETTSSSPPKGNSKPKKVSKSSEAYERDASVVAFVEKRADGICELCSEPAPFNRPDGSPFLEVHHIVPLGEGGPDTVGNGAALCPNCHRACHYGIEVAKHRKALLNKISDKSLLPTTNAAADL